MSTQSAVDPALSSDVFKLDGLVAVVTGGGSGLGATIARALAQNGAAKVYIIGRRAEKLEEVAALFPDVIVPCPGDVTKEQSLLDAAAKVKAEIGYLNLVVANAGTFGNLVWPQGDVPISEYVKAHWAGGMSEFTDSFHLNVTSVLFTSLAFLELLDVGNKKGNMGPYVQSQIIINTSVAAFSRNYSFDYGVSKAAATHLAKMQSTLFSPYDIRVNSLNVGYFPTEMTEGFLNSVPRVPGAPEGADFPKDFIPARRLGTDSDLAGTVVYMASRAGGFVNGNVMVVDGGKIGQEKGTY